MSKVITSPVARWPGTVTLSDPLTWPQVFAWRDAWEEAQKYVEPGGREGTLDITDTTRYQITLLAGVLKCIESHTLKGLPSPLTVDTFPTRPLFAALALAGWLNNEVAAVVIAEEEIPNGSRPASTPGVKATGRSRRKSKPAG